MEGSLGRWVVGSSGRIPTRPLSFFVSRFREPAPQPPIVGERNPSPFQKNPAASLQRTPATLHLQIRDPADTARRGPTRNRRLGRKSPKGRSFKRSPTASLLTKP